MAILLPGSGTGHSTSPARLAAWTVVKQPDGSVKVTLHEIRDPARLQHILRADGIPAKIHTGQFPQRSRYEDPGDATFIR